jgi:hypothetical protein
LIPPLRQIPDIKKHPSLSIPKDRRYTCGATLLGEIYPPCFFRMQTHPSPFTPASRRILPAAFAAFSPPSGAHLPRRFLPRFHRPKLSEKACAALLLHQKFQYQVVEVDFKRLF